MVINVLLFLDILLITHCPWKHHGARIPVYKNAMIVAIIGWTLLIVVNFQKEFIDYMRNEVVPKKGEEQPRGFDTENMWFAQLIFVILIFLLLEIALIIAVHVKLRQQFAGHEVQWKLFNRYTMTLLFVFIP